MCVSELLWNERYYMPQETGNYSVAGFRLNMKRKMTHYVITYYLPSGLFVVVSWASFLIPSDDIQVSWVRIPPEMALRPFQRYYVYIAFFRKNKNTRDCTCP